MFVFKASLGLLLGHPGDVPCMPRIESMSVVFRTPRVDARLGDTENCRAERFVSWAVMEPHNLPGLLDGSPLDGVAVGVVFHDAGFGRSPQNHQLLRTRIFCWIGIRSLFFMVSKTFYSGL